MGRVLDDRFQFGFGLISGSGEAEPSRRSVVGVSICDMCGLKPELDYDLTGIYKLVPNSSLKVSV